VLNSPALLAFDPERTEGHLQRVFGIERVPYDTAMRELLDPVDSSRAAASSSFERKSGGHYRGKVMVKVAPWPT
jgi:hypothetical protein